VNESENRLVLVDSLGVDAQTGRCVAYWSRRDVPAGAVSIPSCVDRDAFELRDEYVRWVHDLGDSRVSGKSIRAHLAFWPDFSHWWMGLISEKAPLKSPGVYSVFKLRALERLYQERSCHGILYIGSDRQLGRTIGSWCRALGHPYIWRRSEPSDGVEPTRHPVAKRLPWVVQGLGYLLMKWWGRYRIARRGALRVPAARSPQAIVITYFPNIDIERTNTGRFWSRYWEQLHDVLDRDTNLVNWLWLYVDSDQASFKDAVRLRGVCNDANPSKYRHFLLDEFASVRVIGRALRTYIRSCLASVRLHRAQDAFHMPGSNLNFFPILASDWYSSLRGIVAMDGALVSELFDAAARILGTAVWTLYVWENQPWEGAAITTWRRRANGRIIGVQHATLPPLDLRAFFDPRELEAPDRERRVIPDLLAVNGEGARDIACRSGFPPHRVVMTEALRYSHLRQVRKREGSSSTLLIATGIKRSEVAQQLKLLAAVAERGALAKYRRVLIKPHPFCAVESLAEEYGLPLRGEIVTDPLSTLLPQANAAFVANSTSALAEALYLGVPTAVCTPTNEMNLSPAFGCPGVPMVSTAEALEAFLRSPASVPWPADFLLVDPSLPRWRRLLSA
jgi:surface carbohydrate biosynthesis protein (TIGR04326 family)